MKIHIIDDNTEITKMFSKYFTLKNHECSVSNDGHNALAILESQKFDVVLLDLAMPNFSGYDIVDHLAKNGKIKDMTIVVLTASTPPHDYGPELMSKGVRIVLKKPIDPDDLLHCIQQFERKK